MKYESKGWSIELEPEEVPRLADGICKAVVQVGDFIDSFMKPTISKAEEVK